jgi:hypothetical protein
MYKYQGLVVCPKCGSLHYHGEECSRCVHKIKDARDIEIWRKVYGNEGEVQREREG